jgi:hypothetical protein
MIQSFSFGSSFDRQLSNSRNRPCAFIFGSPSEKREAVVTVPSVMYCPIQIRFLVRYLIRDVENYRLPIWVISRVRKSVTEAGCTGEILC